MQPSDRFRKMPAQFWAYVRLVSQDVGYSRDGAIVVPTLDQIRAALLERDLNTDEVMVSGDATPFGTDLIDYFAYRAEILNGVVEPLLRDADAARQDYLALLRRLSPSSPQPMNKQKGDKRAPAYLTCMVNMLIEEALDGMDCDYDPRELLVVSLGGNPLRTLSRRVDGACPSATDPIAIWEIKEYYYTTTFGSRVADGVYESLLDGMELEDLEAASGRRIEHLLMVDSHFTWWECGKSYLCRLVDMLNMGFVDHILFGREIESDLPRIAAKWRERLRAMRSAEPLGQADLAAENPSGWSSAPE